MEMPLTLDWLIAGRERKSRRSTCSACGDMFSHGRSWTGPCPGCVARGMDIENAAGLAVANRLGLPGFAMFRRGGDTAIYCRWVCEACGHESRRTLMAMQEMTAWKATCPDCVRVPRYAALAKSRYENLARRAQRMAAILGLEILGTEANKDFPEPGNVIAQIVCKTCGDQRCRSVLELELGRGCSCSMPYSRGEAAIAAYLKLREIPFVREFNMARLGLPANLRFDFYVERGLFAIEYDGQQHYEPIEYFGGLDAFNIRKLNDQRKDELAATLGIYVLRVPYHCENISAFLNKELEALHGH